MSTFKPVIVAVSLVVLNAILLVILVTMATYKLTGNSTDRSRCSLNVSAVHGLMVNDASAESQRVEALSRNIANIYNDRGNVDKAAAHIIIDPGAKYTGDVPTLSWRQDLDATFVSEKMSYTDGGLTVTHGGYYFIYSQIVYSGSGTQELDYGRIIHAVVKQKASELEEAPTPLMRNLQSTPSIRRGRPAYTTSSLGATFYLEANTRVKVMSSVPGNIHVGAPQSNYFGMFLI
ncbi:lymphotoxin-alpha-like [Haliotis rufescens]|uniref:lymphotoxin-alpha-like n=1 Tax=Haliotis rufescens TaxID=6454 RepID=UPI00201F8442|nr:lymphotoxin-alpha-like [Haliotis rufescens]XP_048242854.1 lymphotoxin-alpha-like [Haliotis rufescens]XP_048242855.1 lymphotoxin-alpha-like [Haliotis rufescens]